MNPGTELQLALQALRAAAARDLMTLAVLHDQELTAERVQALKAVAYPTSLCWRLESEQGRQALGLLTEGLAALPESPSAAVLDQLAADYADIYLTHGVSASPCESVWLDEDGLAMQGPMFAVRAFYQRHGFLNPDWRKRADDHLVLQLQCLSQLLDPEAPTGDRAQAVPELRELLDFMDEHLLRWIEDFADRVVRRCATPFYAGLAALTAAYLLEFRAICAEALDYPRPTAAELQARLGEGGPIPDLSHLAYLPGAEPSW